MAGKESNKIISRRIANAWVSAVVSITLVLLLIGVVSLILVNTGSVADYLKENMRVSVIMGQSVSEDEAMSFKKTLDRKVFVRSSEFISKERGISEMTEMLGDDFLSVFDAAPIPVSIDLTVKAEYVNSDSLDVIRDVISASPLVDEIVYQRSLVDALNDNLRKIFLVLAAFIALMLFISFVLISNTVRLNVYNRRFTVHTMKLVGATKRFIRAPFMVQGLFQGLVSSMTAVLVLLGLLFLVKKQFAQFFEIFTCPQLVAVLAIIVVSGVALCVVSTYFVVGRLVSRSREDLYF
ncbi:MAG: permease-like cell division protein FtsX [Bacteroidales bacterium]|nr:permease-like cell division protein FtsX [Bacteroidales bacterium]